MTSTPSDPVAARHGGTAFPARAQLPRNVTIPPIPGLGTTWYERGVSYWSRRAGITLFTLVILAVWTAMIGAFVRASGPAGSPAFIAVLTAEAVFSLTSGAWLLNRFWRHTAHPWRSGRAATGHTRGTGGTGASIGLLARAGSTTASVILGIGVLLTYGLFLAAFITSLAPVLPTEQDARLHLAKELRDHQHPGHGHKPTSTRRDDHY